jgi:hypothetical protein
MGDRALGGFGLALAAFFSWQATQIEESFISDPVGPKIFPMIIGGVFAHRRMSVELFGVVISIFCFEQAKSVAITQTIGISCFIVFSLFLLCRTINVS